MGNVYCALCKSFAIPCTACEQGWWKQNFIGQAILGLDVVTTQARHLGGGSGGRPAPPGFFF